MVRVDPHWPNDKKGQVTIRGMTPKRNILFIEIGIKGNGKYLTRKPDN
jgi:hypothetical protein